jgi:hypothetical protein
MKLAVCGDSWFSTDIRYPNASFGQVLAQQNDWKLLDLARPGCSNFAICLQVDRAIELGADFVVVGTTSPDRVEIPLLAKKKSLWEKLKDLTWENWFDNQLVAYEKSKGLSNINYSPYKTNDSYFNDPTIISESLNNLAFSDNFPLTNEQFSTLKPYMINLFDSGAKRQVDSWIISDACRRLQKANIPFILFIEQLFQWDYSSDISWLPEDNVLRPRDFSIWTDLPRAENDCTEFHYHQDCGHILSNYLGERINGIISTSSC